MAFFRLATKETAWQRRQQQLQQQQRRTLDSVAVRHIFAQAVSFFRRPGGSVYLRLSCLGVLENLLSHIGRVEGASLDEAKEMVGKVFGLAAWTMFGEAAERERQEDEGEQHYWHLTPDDRLSRGGERVEASFRATARSASVGLAIEGGNRVSLDRASAGEKSAAFLGRGFRSGVLSWKVRVLEDSVRGRHNSSVGLGLTARTSGRSDPHREAWVLRGGSGLVRGDRECPNHVDLSTLTEFLHSIVGAPWRRGVAVRPPRPSRLRQGRHAFVRGGPRCRAADGEEERGGGQDPALRRPPRGHGAPPRGRLRLQRGRGLRGSQVRVIFTCFNFHYTFISISISFLLSLSNH